MLFQKLMMSLREAGEKDGTWRAYATNGATVMLTEGGLGRERSGADGAPKIGVGITSRTSQLNGSLFGKKRNNCPERCKISGAERVDRLRLTRSHSPQVAKIQLRPVIRVFNEVAALLSWALVEAESSNRRCDWRLQPCARGRRSWRPNPSQPPRKPIRSIGALRQ